MTLKVLPFEGIDGSSPRAWTQLVRQHLQALSFYGNEASREAAVDLIRAIHRGIPGELESWIPEVLAGVAVEEKSEVVDSLWTAAASCAYLVAILGAEGGLDSTWPVSAYQCAVRYLRRLFTVDECDALLNLLDLQTVTHEALAAALPGLPVRELR